MKSVQQRPRIGPKSIKIRLNQSLRSNGLVPDTTIIIQNILQRYTLRNKFLTHIYLFVKGSLCHLNQEIILLVGGMDQGAQRHQEAG